MPREWYPDDYLAAALSQDVGAAIASKVARKFGPRWADPTPKDGNTRPPLFIGVSNEPPVEEVEGPPLRHPGVVGVVHALGASVPQPAGRKFQRAGLGPLSLPDAVENPKITAQLIIRK